MNLDNENIDNQISKWIRKTKKNNFYYGDYDNCDQGNNDYYE